MRDIDIAQHFITAATAAMFTMANLIVTPGKFFVKHDKKPFGDITAIINVTGHRVGSISVSFTRQSATALVIGMLGDDVEDLEQDMRDSVGEFTNMVSGQARASMATAGIVLQGSTPTLVMDSEADMEYMTEAPIISIPFSAKSGEFTVEFCLSKP